MMDIAVFGSGRGSNFQAILTAVQRGEIPGARIVLVISNNSSAGILATARAHDIPAMHLSQLLIPDEQEHVDAILAALNAHGVTFIVLAGYMKRLHPSIIAAYRNRIVNIHPALLPQFGGKGMHGMHVHEAVLAAGATESGATVHMVDEEYDHGAIVLQRRVPVLPGDTPETLAARVLIAEHEAYPAALRAIAAGTTANESFHRSVRG
jgi:phosphoribosylglycinamide formyltransferase-1